MNDKKPSAINAMLDHCQRREHSSFIMHRKSLQPKGSHDFGLVVCPDSGGYGTGLASTPRAWVQAKYQGRLARKGIVARSEGRPSASSSPSRWCPSRAIGAVTSQRAPLAWSIGKRAARA
jgi:hypothetical protein